MRPREVAEFRTPQHPSLGTNHWGGASPLLARNIPKESLDQRYLRLNTIRTRDEIFPVMFEHHVEKKSGTVAPKVIVTIRELLPNLGRQRNKGVKLGGVSWRKMRWFPRLDPQNRWPQGWC